MVLEEIEAYFAPVQVKRVPLFTHEVLGASGCASWRGALAPNEDPAAVSASKRLTPS